ncbi:ATP-binding cassette domain-containing protein [Frankia sp. Cas3]|uniref:ATP-binding cassette domain-containing protein n=1 Tax=Frankia sp. Cas3 TaxID=3073926 RepID=UPI002AD3B833|nr:ATP-binding cassette domain-containing protein [Frankia sp. Cas3]
MDRTSLQVNTPIGQVVLAGCGPYVVGRARQSDIVIVDSRVSWRHFVLESGADGWQVRDTSANGLWQDGRRVGNLNVSAAAVRLRLGAADGPEVVLIPQPRLPRLPRLPRQPVGPEPGDRPADRPADPAAAFAGGDDDAGLCTSEQPIVGDERKVHRLRPGQVTLGRSRDNDLVVDDLLASRHHAQLHVGAGVGGTGRGAGGWGALGRSSDRHGGVEVVDLGSANGTFVNGRRITHAPVAQRDVVAIGHHLFQLDGDTLVEYFDSGDVTFEVQGLSVWAGAKQLMNDVTFRLPARSLLGVVGPSGAGKSTLLNALTGFRPADAGTVRYAGRDLYAEYDELRRRIGYVPQADPLHSQLTVRQALEYGAELRFPADTTANERRARVSEVIIQLGLRDHADTPVGRLSGGQRKRTSVALELLTRPTLLFLDEPTSGLDPANDQSVMEALHGLARGSDGAATAPGAGRTVIVVTHSVLFLDLCDYLLVLAPGGHVAYFGPSAGALRFFGKKDFKEFVTVFRELEATAGAVLAARFRASEDYVPAAVVAPLVRRSPALLPSVGQQPVLAQLSTLTRRYLRVVLADQSYLRLIVVFPFLLGIIPRVIPARDGLAALPVPNPDATKVLVVLVLCACFMGMANSVREIVKERQIYRRERTIGLSRTAYLGSKVVVLAVITTCQCVVFTLIGLLGRMPTRSVLLGSPLAECIIAVLVAALSSMMIGLLVSTLVDNADKTMPVLVLVTMGQLVLSGGLVSAVGRFGLEQISWLAPARWGFAALGATTDLNSVAKLGTLGRMGPRGDPPDPLWAPNAATWLTDVILGTSVGVVALILTAYMIRRIEPKVGRRKTGADPPS